jgi:hypothetical protein
MKNMLVNGFHLGFRHSYQFGKWQILGENGQKMISPADPATPFRRPRMAFRSH